MKNKNKNRSPLFSLIGIIVTIIIIISSIFLAVRLLEDRKKVEISTHKESVQKFIDSLYHSSFYNDPFAVIKTIGGNSRAILLAFTKGDTIYAQKIINNIKKTMGASIVYLMDKKGDILISTTIGGANETLEGNNYKFRPYFQKAINGKSLVYLALGVTTKKRGIYYAAPVVDYSGDKDVVVGVIVLKVGVEKIADIFFSQKQPMLLVSESGVVFVASDKKWLFKQIKGIKHTQIDDKQFSLENVISTLDWDLTKDIIEIDRKSYLVAVSDIKIANVAWKMIGLNLYEPWNFKELILYLMVNFVLLSVINLLLFIYYRLVKAKKDAEQANIVKSTFLANMSYEIKTPISGIIGISELMEDSELTPEQGASLKLVKKLSYSLLDLINDILDYSKIETDRINLKIVTFDFYKLVKEIDDLFFFRAREKSIQFKSTVDSDLPQYLKGDPIRIRQVLTNLLSNAIKFTEKGSVDLIIKKKDQLNDRVTLLIEVRDTGIGIDIKHQDEIFGHVSPIDNSATSVHGGIGLGLAISKRFVEMMGGMIWPVSILGEGASFFVSLPVLIPKKSENIKDDNIPAFKNNSNWSA